MTQLLKSHHISEVYKNVTRNEISVYLSSQSTKLPGTGIGIASLTISPGCFHFHLLRSPVKQIPVIQ